MSGSRTQEDGELPRVNHCRFLGLGRTVSRRYPLADAKNCIAKPRVRTRSFLRHLRHARGYGHILHHAAEYYRPDRSAENASAVSTGIVRVLANGFPVVSMEVVRESDFRSACGLAIIGDTFIVVRTSGSTG